ncbi:MAG: TonB-dependent receptor [Prevotellaceae bacterium]|jgi:hypothetical protein|nr:TonB-dependent receptor [Prevotellaceae bacterium]
MNVKALLLLAAAITASFANAQSLKGRVTDATNAEPLAFANILVIDNQPDINVAGTVTGAEGNFELACHAQQLRVKVSYLGYVTKDTVLTCNEFNAISLQPDAKVLGEVVVTGNRKIFKLENGGISTDVANSPLKDLGVASDVLEQIPFVVKNDDKISVLGKGTPLIYINNRLVRNNNELERLSSGNIKKITVITNPGPEYDATVSAVIRIEAVRPQGEGLGGELYGRIIARRKLTEDAHITLNYRKNNLDLFGDYWFQPARTALNTILDRTLTLPSKTVLMSSSADQTHSQKYQNVEGGFNYDFNTKHSVGAKYTYTYVPSTGNLYLPTTVTELTSSAPAVQSVTHTDFINPNRSHLVNAYYTGNIAPWLRAQLDVDYSTGTSKQTQNSVTERAADERVNTYSEQDYDLYAAKLTLTTPVWGSELRYGAEVGHTTNEQSYLVKDNEGAEQLTSNTNLAKQQTTAAFASFNKSLTQRWSFNVGVRYENVGFDYYEDHVKKDEQSKTYSNLFPTAGISYRGEKVQMSLGYRSTISRPGYYQLRNAIQYDDPYTYEQGNPYLQPTRMDDITYTLMWRNLQVMASYKTYKDYISSLISPWEMNNDIVIYTAENIPHAQEANLSVNYTPTFGLWTPSATVSVNKSFLEVNGYSAGRPYVSYQWLNTFKLPANFTFRADIMGNFNGYQMEQQILSNFRVDARVTKTFLKGNLIINFIARDVFNTYNLRWRQDTSSVATYRSTDNDTRGLTLSVRYKFNTTRSKYKGSSASEAERSRL